MYLVLTQQNFFQFFRFEGFLQRTILIYSFHIRWNEAPTETESTTCHQKINISNSEKILRKISIYNTALFFLQIQEPYLFLLPIFVGFHCYHAACKTRVFLMNRNYDLNLGNAYNHTNNLSVAILSAGELMLQVDNITILETNSSSHSRRLRVLFSK